MRHTASYVYQHEDEHTRRRACPPSDKKLREDVDERWGCQRRRWLRIGKPTPGRHIRRTQTVPLHPSTPNEERRNLVEGWRGQPLERQLFRSLKIGDLVCPVCKQGDRRREGGSMEFFCSISIRCRIHLRNADLSCIIRTAAGRPLDSSYTNFVGLDVHFLHR